MLAFQSEQSPAGTTIMNRLAKGYSEAEVDALAIYFSQISPEAPVESVSPTATSKEAK
jgi:cytochrome c553